MRLIIYTQQFEPGVEVAVTWQTGDPVEDLEHAANLILQYANHLKTPNITAASAQQPLPTNGTTTSH